MADLSSLKGSSDIVDTTSPLNTQPSAIPHGVKMSILDCSRKAIEGVKNAVNACLLAGTLAMGAAPAMAEGAPVAPASTTQKAELLTKVSADDMQLTTELKALGYSESESLQVAQLMSNSRRFTKELGLSVPLVSMGFTPVSDKVSDRLRIMNKDFENLSNLKSKTIEQAIWVETITPENIKQVLIKIHTLDSEEKTTMYGDDMVRTWAGERTRERQKKGWIDRNLPRISATDLEKACQTANAWLANAEYISTDVARIIITTALDLYTPAPDYGAAPSEAQKITLANRPLNFAQSIAWMTAIAKPGVAYRANNKEIITVTVNDITYSFAPESRVQWMPGIPSELRWITSKAYTQLQAAQNNTIAYNKEMNGMKAVIAQKDASIAQKDMIIADSKAVIADSKAAIADSKAAIADSKAVIAQKEQHTIIITTTDSIRAKLLPLLAAYLGADSKKQEDIRNSIIPLARQLREAEQFTRTIQPLTEENRIEQGKSIEIIQEMYALVTKTGVDLRKI